MIFFPIPRVGKPEWVTTTVVLLEYESNIEKEPSAGKRFVVAKANNQYVVCNPSPFLDFSETNSPQ